MKAFIEIMAYLREEMVHEGLFLEGQKHSRSDKRYIRRALKELL